LEKVSFNVQYSEYELLFVFCNNILLQTHKTLVDFFNYSLLFFSLKPENVILDKEGYIRISDFGLSKANVDSHNSAFSFCGTPEYLAPEILSKNGHGKPVDWWALGKSFNSKRKD